jgi:hypothetical protein
VAVERSLATSRHALHLQCSSSFVQRLMARVDGKICDSGTHILTSSRKFTRASESLVALRLTTRCTTVVPSRRTAVETADTIMSSLQPSRQSSWLAAGIIHLLESSWVVQCNGSWATPRSSPHHTSRVVGPRPQRHRVSTAHGDAPLADPGNKASGQSLGPRGPPGRMLGLHVESDLRKS